MPAKRRNDLRAAMTASLEGVAEAAVALKEEPRTREAAPQRPRTAPRPVRRAWAPAAAMEPIEPLAPPPARPLAPLPNAPGSIAEGGKKMNILPLLMAALILVILGVVMVALLHPFGVRW